ncbi:hypothetical protein PR048_001048 [Dryococelus australis]|uniref:Uncharacterized protein n=1 Tax=Dryococelus australis TaxID=614101 RepID=A0ABQ9IGD3_9NEOP|nr:hypothetical protein PR048_001048 [Dryococelus australis]
MVQQMQYKYSSVSSTPSPQPSLSPQSQGRTPSPMDYRNIAAAPMYPPFRMQLPTGGYGAHGELVFHNLPQSSGGTMINRFTSAVGKASGPYGMPTQAELMGQYMHLSTAPFSVTSMANQTFRDAGMMVGIQGVPPRYAGLPSVPPNEPEKSSKPTPDNANILDLDNQPITLDSGELVNLVLFDGNLSESLSANLSISDVKQQAEPTREGEAQENMTDSLTRLTNTTLQEINTLNNMCRYRENQ